MISKLLHYILYHPWLWESGIKPGGIQFLIWLFLGSVCCNLGNLPMYPYNSTEIHRNINCLQTIRKTLHQASILDLPQLSSFNTLGDMMV